MLVNVNNNDCLILYTDIKKLHMAIMIMLKSWIQSKIILEHNIITITFIENE